MSLLADLVKTAGDALRLSSDVVRYKLEVQRQAVKRRAGRLGICLAVGLIALGFVGAGIGLLLHGAYVLIAYHLGPGPSALIVGGASLLFAGFLVLLVCGSMGRS